MESDLAEIVSGSAPSVYDAGSAGWPLATACFQKFGRAVATAADSAEKDLFSRRLD
jgi:hypothetical protein